MTDRAPAPVEAGSSQENAAAFTCSYTQGVPELLAALRCTLVLSTYQAGKVVFLSATPKGLIQLPRTFQKPMGLALAGGRLAIATRYEVVVLANAPGLAPGYPNSPGVYDGLYAPRATYYTGELDLHDMAWGAEGLWAVNTRFSCLSLITEAWSFEPRWKPPYVTELAPEDRCHLNGLAMADGKPAYATALAATDAQGAWREGRLTGGLLMHVPSGEVVETGLAMPHSPRLYDGKLYFLNSSSGELCLEDAAGGKHEVLCKLPGFVRGLARAGAYLLIGLSKVRERHIFSGMAVAKEETFAGIAIVHLSTARVAGVIRYSSSCEEIYDVQVIPGFVRPGIMSHSSEVFRRCLVTPQDTFWAREEPEEPEAGKG